MAVTAGDVNPGDSMAVAAVGGDENQIENAWRLLHSPVLHGPQTEVKTMNWIQVVILGAGMDEGGCRRLPGTLESAGPVRSVAMAI